MDTTAETLRNPLATTANLKAAFERVKARFLKAQQIRNRLLEQGKAVPSKCAEAALHHECRLGNELNRLHDIEWELAKQAEDELFRQREADIARIFPI